MPYSYETAYVVVDDDEDDRALMRFALQNAQRPLPVLEFEDGQALLDYLDDQKRQRPDADMHWVVIMDVNMPRLNGFETVSALRSNPHWHKLPVLMLSTSDHPDMAKEALRRGANYYVAKPAITSEYTRIFDEYVAPFLAVPSAMWPTLRVSA